MGNKESNESAAVKRQAEGFSNPMYQLLDLSGSGLFFDLSQKAMLSGNDKELDDAIRQKIPPYLYNEGKGKWIHCAHLACLRNRDRPKSRMFPEIRALGDNAFSYQFEDSPILAQYVRGQTYQTHPENFTQHCWNVENRGAVGETTFHVCFLMGSPVHIYCAKRLLAIFPLLLHDVYLSEEYFGENVLHMSCVAEDPSMVKWLLDIGSDFHRRCHGNFFTCDDQKSGRMDTIEQEEPIVPAFTNYAGYVAWGEYPMNFAAVLDQEECYRLILSKGGNADLQDVNGCTVAHILVVYDNLKMFDMAVECGAAINIENKASLTPLTMAAYLARMDMFFHIASIEREVYWQLGNVTCSAYPLKYLDTIHSQTGELQTKSALNLIVFGLDLAHLDLIEYVIVDLLRCKWNSFIKAVFFRQFFIFFLFFILSSFCFVTRVNQTTTSSWACSITNNTNITSLQNFTIENLDTGDFLDDLSLQLENWFSMDENEDDPAKTVESLNDSFIQLEVNSNSLNVSSFSNGTSELKKDIEEEEEEEEEKCKIPEELLDHCYLHKYDTFFKKFRGCCEVSLVVWSLVYILTAIREFTFLGKVVFKQTILLCPSRIFFLIACLLTQVMVITRLACWHNGEDTLAITVMLFTGFYFLFFCRGFKLVGPMVIMVYRMLAQDLTKFGTIFFIFMAGWSQSFYIIFQSYKFESDDKDIQKQIDDNGGECPDDFPNDNNVCQNNPMPNWQDASLGTFFMALGEVFDVWSGLNYTHHVMIGRIHWFLFLSLMVILLLNLLIAMMGDTYTKIAEIKNEWMRQWARCILIVERGIPPKERLKQQNLYCDINSEGDKALVMKQFLSDEKVEEINEIIEMKVTHRKNIERKRARFGHESVSKMGLNMAGAAVIVPDSSDGTDPENPYG